MHEVICSHCKRKVQTDARHGAKVLCPFCEKHFFVRSLFTAKIENLSAAKKSGGLNVPFAAKLRSLNYLAILSIVFASLLCVSVALVLSSRSVDRHGGTRQVTKEEYPVATNTFKYASDKLVIVECGDSMGSGFLIEEGTNKFLITNEHILRGGKGVLPRFKLLSGIELDYDDVEIAEDRDLARVGIPQRIPAFDLEDRLPVIGERVKVFGNSEGGGVATELEGEIQGVGPMQIETDAKFVKGNSGSPLVNARGRIVGVATLITCHNDKKDWTKKDTRFNDVRRYAVRLNGVKWQRYEWGEYSEHCKRLSDICTFYEALQPYLFAFYNDVDGSYLTYNNLREDEYFLKHLGLHKCMMAVSESYELLEKSFEEWKKYAKGREGFVEKLRSAENVDNRLAYLDEYDRETQIAQSKIIERLYDFNEAKDDAVNKLEEIIGSLDGNKLVRNGYEGERGLNSCLKGIQLIRKDLTAKLTSGNVYEVAVDLITGRHGSKKNLGLGSLLLFDWAVDGDRPSQASFVEFYLDGKVEVDYRLLDKVKPWFLSAYQNGNKKAAFVLGECEYAKRNFKNALRYWEESANAGVAEGWMRIGKYYSLPEDKGGGPLLERSDARAKEAFAKAAAYNNQDGVARLSQQALGHVLLRSDDPADWKKALKEFHELADKDSDSGVYPYYYGVAYWKLCQKEWDDRVGYYFDKAKYWYGERDRANAWIEKHQDDYPADGEYELVQGDLYNPPYRRQTWRYRKFVENWNRAVDTQKKAIANIDKIWKPFEDAEKYDLIRKMRDALSYVERAERLNVEGAKEYAEACRSKIKKLAE